MTKITIARTRPNPSMPLSEGVKIAIETPTRKTTIWLPDREAIEKFNKEMAGPHLCRWIADEIAEPDPNPPT